MCEINLEYLEFVTEERGKKTLYVQVLKVIYGMIESALLWYELFTTTLDGLGSELNPYDRCLANMVINGKQCTIAWYVDDNKVLHMHDKVNTMIADEIEKKLGKLTRTTGWSHTFLRVDIDFIGDGKVAISRPQHLEECMEDFGKTLKGNVVNPALSKLFTITAAAAELGQE